MKPAIMKSPKLPDPRTFSISHRSQKSLGSSDNRKSPSLGTLFLAFLKLGATAFGGPAAAAQIRKEIVGKRRWLDDETFCRGLALCQAIPGATSMQVAAYTGLKLGGFSGALAGFIGYGLPAFILMMILSAAYITTSSLPPIISIFAGLQVIIVAIIAHAALIFAKTALKSLRYLLIALISGVLFYLKLSPLLVIIASGLLGLVLIRKCQALPAPQQMPAKSISQKPLLITLSLAVIGFFLLLFLNRSLFNLSILLSGISLLSFGGAYSAIGLMFQTIAGKNAWLSSQTLLNGIALGQITPGPIMMTSTFIGYLLYGPFGGAVATIAMFLPAFLVVIGIEPYFCRLQSSRGFSKAMAGILCSFVGLLSSFAIQSAQAIPWSLPKIILGAAAFISLVLGLDIIWVVIGGIAASLIFL